MEQILADGWAERVVGNSNWGYDIFLQGTDSILQVEMDNDIVKTISGGIKFDYPLRTMIEQFGPPEGVRSLQKSTQCSVCKGQPFDLETLDPAAEAPRSILLYLLYPEQGLFFWGWILGSRMGCLCPEIKMKMFCYYEPMTMSEAFEDDRLADLCLPVLEEFTEADLVEWHGFGGGY